MNSRNHCLIFACLFYLMSTVGASHSVAVISSLTVEPPDPQCTDVIVLSVAGSFPDGCWRVVDTQFSILPNSFSFEITAVDDWSPGAECPQVIVPYDMARSQGHVQVGTYTLRAVERVTSRRLQGDRRSIPFEVTCRPHGIVERGGISICLESHKIIDPCTHRSAVLESSAVNLDGLLCQHVAVEGPEVGVECVVIDVQQATPAEPGCEFEVWDLLAQDEAATWLAWQPFPCAETYDVIRGDLPGLSIDGSVVDLGPVNCLANDLPFPTTSQGPLDAEVPAPGHAFSYLVRARTPFGLLPYGFTNSGLVRTPSSGDCPL